MLNVHTNKQNWRVLISKNPNLVTVNNHIIYYPTPASINYYWSFGSLAGIIFALQLVSGIILAMHYTSDTTLAFASVEHLMTDVNGGYFFRYSHANGASMIFILLYIHILRAMYYQSYISRPTLWYSGLILFLLMMATAFIGYVLPWGQMSFWGATVITSLVTAVPYIGEDIAYWIWGGFSINNATLTRFFALHYLLPFLIVGLVLLHLVLLHTSGSTNSVSVERSTDRVTFHPYFTYKDLFALSAILSGFCFLVFMYSNYLGHSDNFIPANPLVTPAHIVPEWYFTPFYAILRACPNKIGGAISMLFAILIFFILPTLHSFVANKNFVVSTYSFLHKSTFWSFVSIFLLLMLLGLSPAEEPYIILSKICTTLYFFTWLFVMPFSSYITALVSTTTKLPTN